MSALSYLSPEDLTEFIEDASESKLAAIISDVYAEILTEAPSLEDVDVELTAPQTALVTSIMRSAAIRHEESRAGALSTNQAMSGSYSEMAVIRGSGLLTSRQIKQLQDLEAAISGGVSGKVKEYDLLGNCRPSGGSQWVNIGWRSL